MRRWRVPAWAAACTDVGPLAELLAAGEQQTLEFFVVRLKEVSGPTVDHPELLYNASVLAHYAQVSTHSPVDLATPATLAAVFDHFVFERSLQDDSAMMEAAGAQCLLLAGFFEDQLRRRHNIRWYAHLGVGFFSQAAALERSPQKVRLLAGIAEGFERWRQRYARLSRELRDQPYLLVRPPLIVRLPVLFGTASSIRVLRVVLRQPPPAHSPHFLRFRSSQ